MRQQFSYRANRQLDELPSDVQQRIKGKLDFFVSQEDPFKFAIYIAVDDLYRFRVGDYRVFFEILNGVLWITDIERRDKAYD